MACRQQQQIESQRQLLAAKEQRLRFLKQHEAKHQLVATEHERLRRLRQKVETQEQKLRKLRALRGQVDQTKLNNVSLSTYRNAHTSPFIRRVASLRPYLLAYFAVAANVASFLEYEFYSVSGDLGSVLRTSTSDLYDGIFTIRVARMPKCGPIPIPRLARLFLSYLLVYSHPKCAVGRIASSIHNKYTLVYRIIIITPLRRCNSSNAIGPSSKTNTLKIKLVCRGFKYYASCWKYS